MEATADAFYACLSDKRTLLAFYQQSVLHAVDVERVAHVQHRLSSARTLQECQAIRVTDALQRTREGCYFTATAMICDL